MKKDKRYTRYRRAEKGEGRCLDCLHVFEGGTVWWPQLKCKTASVVSPAVDYSGTCDGWKAKDKKAQDMLLIYEEAK